MEDLEASASVLIVLEGPPEGLLSVGDHVELETRCRERHGNHGNNRVFSGFHGFPMVFTVCFHRCPSFFHHFPMVFHHLPLDLAGFRGLPKPRALSSGA